MNLKLSYIFTFISMYMFCSSSEKIEERKKLEDPNSPKYSSTRFGKIAYWEKGAGPDVYLLHGAGHDHQDYEAILNDLSLRFHTISIDWLGHGKSDSFESYDNASAIILADALEEFVSNKSPHGAIFIGNSVGGFAAARLAIRKPNLVKALILVDSGGFNPPSLKGDFFVYLKSKEWFTSLIWNILPNYYIKKNNQTTENIKKRIKYSKNNPGAVTTNANIWASFAHPDHNLLNQVGKIQAPTLLVWGSNDPIIQLSVGKLLEEKMPGNKLRVLHTGHVPFAEKPEQFLYKIQFFLSKFH